jgi:site-specific recombinase XerD
MTPTDFAKALSDYLGAYLPGQRNLSSNTLKSYRDTFKLFLRYCKQECHLAVEKLCLKRIDKRLVLGFLQWLENERHNGISTRNQRLACIHGFYQYLQIEEPVALLSCQEILSIPMKKAPVPTINYLTPDALKLVLAQPDPLKASGRRDLTLLCVLYDTGARVQEVADLRVKDVRPDPPLLTLTGKGGKIRQVPLMSNTQDLLQQYMGEVFSNLEQIPDYPLFFNRQHRKLTRAGITYILAKYVSQAKKQSATIPDKVSPHVLRHTKAMQLLQAGISLIYIRDLLGHVEVCNE